MERRKFYREFQDDKERRTQYDGVQPVSSVADSHQELGRQVHIEIGAESGHPAKHEHQDHGDLSGSLPTEPEETEKRFHQQGWRRGRGVESDGEASAGARERHLRFGKRSKQQTTNKNASHQHSLCHL